MNGGRPFVIDSAISGSSIRGNGAMLPNVHVLMTEMGFINEISSVMIFVIYYTSLSIPVD